MFGAAVSGLSNIHLPQSALEFGVNADRHLERS